VSIGRIEPLLGDLTAQQLDAAPASLRAAP
jgi:hypothetical protein